MISTHEKPKDDASVASDAAFAMMWFTSLAFLWPIVSFVALFMFDAPGSPSIVGWLLFLSTVLYGPIYFIALLVSRTQKRAGNSAGAVKTWIYLCGSDVAVWVVAFLLNFIV